LAARPSFANAALCVKDDGGEQSRPARATNLPVCGKNQNSIENYAHFRQVVGR
jgi:hypothetical protein